MLLRWVPWMRAAMPDVALRVEVGLSDGLMRHLSEGLIDIGVMYSPQSRPGLATEKLLEERLVLVSTTPREMGQWDGGYVFVDWGPEFRAAHSQSFPDLSTPAVSVSLGALGLQHILANGGFGYFPMRVVRPFLQDGRLYGVPDARNSAAPPIWSTRRPTNSRNGCVPPCAASLCRVARDGRLGRRTGRPDQEASRVRTVWINASRWSCCTPSLASR